VKPSRHCIVSAVMVLGVLAGPFAHAQSPQSSGVLFENARVFDGTSERLSPPSNVLVLGNTIETISPAPISSPSGAAVTKIDGGGRVRMPGLIDAHWHTVMSANTMLDLMSGDIGLVYLSAGKRATETLLRGFTSVRDLGGPVFGVKRAIDQGVLVGPRIYPSGATVSQTSGHGDFRTPVERARRFTGAVTYAEAIGATVIADGVDEVLTAVRENLRQGTSQIKLMAGGGVASPAGPLDVTQYLDEELRAAVRAAADWGPYVAVHVYGSTGVRRAVEAGVKVIEHGHLMDEATIKLLADKGVWLSMQPFEFTDNTYPTEAQQAKNRQVSDGTNDVYT
jgi:imidazolonepropionase-like amidohydrolase